VKTRLFDHQVRANLAAYYYKYTGLQVGAIVPPEPGQLPVNRVVNAGAARTFGIDFDASFRPRAIEGLELNASINWNDGKYTRLDNIPCWVGQTVALGCNEVLNSNTQLYTAQNLSGTPMIRAPKIQSTFGFSYEKPIASGLKLVFTNSNQYSTKYVRFLAINRPDNDNYQSSFIKMDASVALRGPEDRWEIALIGKNINDRITAGICSAGNYAGGLFIVPAVTGGNDPGPAGFGQTNCFPERGRSVWFRLTVRPFN
jgi:outer membrane receptor protein involved in Fe transport